MFYFTKQCTSTVRSKLPNANVALADIILTVIPFSQTIERSCQHIKFQQKQVQSFFMNSSVIAGVLSE